MAQATKQEKYDSLLELDDRFQEAVSDANLILKPEESGSRRIGMAVIGVGRMGAIHMYNAIREPRANLLYILDGDAARLEYMRKKYYLDDRGVQVVGLDGWQKILDDKRVEALLISTPTFTHQDYVKGGLEHSKHVLCEKPLAENPETIRALVSLAESKNLKLICAFNRRYDPSFRRIQDQVARGDIGKPLVIKTCSRDSPLPPLEYIKISGGIFHDCCVHDIDLVLWIAKELPTDVHAYAHAHMDDYRNLNDFDTTLVSMKFASGLMSVTDLARLSSTGYEQRVEVYGPKGCIKLDEFPRSGWEKHTDIGTVKANNCYSFASRYVEAYANEITELFNHIEGNKVLEPINPGYLNALCKIIHAIEESARTQKPVKLDWTPEELSRPL